MVGTRDQEKTDSSIFRNRIRIDGEEPSSSKIKSLCREAGHQWPPRDQAEAVAVLKKAGFSGQRIDQLLHFMGVPGFEGAGELPEGYTSVGKPRFRERALTPDEFSKEFGVPTFTPMLVEGLRVYIVNQKAAARITPEEHGPLGLILNTETRSVTRQGYSECLVSLANKADQWDLLLLLNEKRSVSKQRATDVLGLTNEAAKKLRQRFNNSFSRLNIKMTLKPWSLTEDRPG